MALINDFKAIVNQSPPTIQSTNLIEVANALNIDTAYSLTRANVTDKLYNNIYNALSWNCDDPENLIKRKALFKLEPELVYKYVIYNEDPIIYLKVLQVINDACRPNFKCFPPFTEKDRWNEAITNCKNFLQFTQNRDHVTIENLRKEYPKDYDRAKSVEELCKRGCEVNLVDSEIQINSGLDEIIKELETKIDLFGGLNLIKTIFLNLQEKGFYSEEFERYFLIRTPSGIAFDQYPQIPYGYLLNLSLNFAHSNCQANNPNDCLKEIYYLATLITNGVYDVQPYNYWDFHFHSGDSIIEFCQEIALWDSIFSIHQCKPSIANEIREKLFSKVKDEDFKNYLGFPKNHFNKIVQQIFVKTVDTNGPVILETKELSKSLKLIKGNTINKVLNFLSHENNGINQNYFYPSDYTSINFFKKPLIKLSNEKFLMPDKSWASQNFFESQFLSLKAKDNELSTKIGKALERFIQKKFEKNGINYLTGEYSKDGVQGECDFLIESNDSIVLVELKKKVLTRKSKEGFDRSIFVDLAKSVLESQVQAGKTELILKENGYLDLQTMEGEKRINLNNKEIEKVTLTQQEYGGFQDRVIMRQFLNSLVTHSFHPNSYDPNIKHEFEKLENKRQELVYQYEKLYYLDSNFNKFPFFNCWFFSLPQIIELINKSADADSFNQNLKKTKYITTNTLDWYKEFEYVSKIL